MRRISKELLVAQQQWNEYVFISYYWREMSESNLEQQINIRFSVKIGKNGNETLTLIQMAQEATRNDFSCGSIDGYWEITRGQRGSPIKRHYKVKITSSHHYLSPCQNNTCLKHYKNIPLQLDIYFLTYLTSVNDTVMVGTEKRMQVTTSNANNNTSLKILYPKFWRAESVSVFRHFRILKYTLFNLYGASIKWRSLGHKQNPDIPFTFHSTAYTDSLNVVLYRHLFQYLSIFLK